MFNKSHDHLNRELAPLAVHLPENLWLVLLSADGLLQALHPDFMKQTLKAAPSSDWW